MSRLQVRTVLSVILSYLPFVLRNCDIGLLRVVSGGIVKIRLIPLPVVLLLSFLMQQLVHLLYLIVLYIKYC